MGVEERENEGWKREARASGCASADGYRETASEPTYYTRPITQLSASKCINRLRTNVISAAVILAIDVCISTASFMVLLMFCQSYSKRRVRKRPRKYRFHRNHRGCATVCEPCVNVFTDAERWPRPHCALREQLTTKYQGQEHRGISHQTHIIRRKPKRTKVGRRFKYMMRRRSRVWVERGVCGVRKVGRKVNRGGVGTCSLLPAMLKIIGK